MSNDLSSFKIFLNLKLFMRILNIMKSNYISNCDRPNFKKSYSYWEDRNLTTDENEIIKLFKK